MGEVWKMKVENNLEWSLEKWGGWKSGKSEDWGTHSERERGFNTSVQCWFSEGGLEKLGVKCIEDEVLYDSRRNLGMILLFISLLSLLMYTVLSFPLSGCFLFENV